MFQFPQSREDFMLFVQQVAREDVKKCLAGITTTHPELVQQFVSVSPKQQQPTPTHYQQTLIQQSPPTLSNQSHSSSPPPKISSYSTTPSNSNPTQNTSHSTKNNVSISHQQQNSSSPTKNNQSTPNSNQHVNNSTKLSVATTPKTSPNSKRAQPVSATNKSALKDKSPSPNEKIKKSPTEGKQVTISERLLKPTISMQKKFEKGQVKKPSSSEKQFKELRKEQNKSTSLLLKKKPTTPKKKEVKKPSPKQNDSNNSKLSENSEDDSNIEEIEEIEETYQTVEEIHEEPSHETVENDVDISNISNGRSEESQSNSSTPKKSQSSSTKSSPKNQPNFSTQSSSPLTTPKTSPKREVSQPVIVNQSNSVQSKPYDSSLLPSNNISPTKSNLTNVESEQPSISSISNHSNNPQYDQLEEMVLDDLLKELVREEHLANKQRAQQEIKLIEKKSQQNDKYDEILTLLNQLEQDEQIIRKRFSNKNYLLDSTMNSETSSSTAEETTDDQYDGLGIDTVKVIQKFKRRNKKYFEAFCRPHDLSIDTLMQVIGEDLLKEVIANVCDEFSDAMSDIVKNTAAQEFGMNETTSDISSSMNRTTSEEISSTLKSSI